VKIQGLWRIAGTQCDWIRVLVEKTKEANQAIFVDNQFEDLLKVAAIPSASPSAIKNVIALRG
jgi:hypothetical protein